MSAGDWFLDRSERPWTPGNLALPLVHGRAYFARLLEVLRGTAGGDLVMFTDWRGDPDELLDGSGTEVAAVLRAAAGRGVVIKGLIWRSHHDSLQFSAGPNRELVDAIQEAGGDCLLDMRVKVGGSHHQKLFVVRHKGRPERDVAFVGGIDLCHGRNDDHLHEGDPQPVPMAPVYGERPPWHDVQIELRGPAVADVETVFRERWNDPAPLNTHPYHHLRDLVERRRRTPESLPRRLPDPPAPDPARVFAAESGTAEVAQDIQILRTYPRRRGAPYPFAPKGERSIARGYLKALQKARHLIYVEDQYLWSEEVIRPFAEALRRNPELRMIAVVPLHPDSAHRVVADAQAYGRHQALKVLRKAGGDRVVAYGIENTAGNPIYVHAKVCVIDDTWATVGSDNFNLRSWTYDSELTCAVHDGTGGQGFPRQLRLALAREHLGREHPDQHPGRQRQGRTAADDDADLVDPVSVFKAFAESARALEDWHAGGCAGERPAGQLRHYHPPQVARWRRPLARAVYRLVCDPDARSTRMRVLRRF
jgi:phosphatidylserine/phosphatidylglycerophosphate/cardiolipin synthase-like enzyme